MTGIEKKVSDDLMATMKARKELELSSLRMLKAEFQRAKTDKGHTGDLTEDEIVALVQRLVKQRREAAEQYAAVGAKARADEESREAAFLETYLPEQLSDEEIARFVEETAKRVKASGPKDMGRVIGGVMAEVKGRADGKRVRDAVQSWLQSRQE